MVEVDKHVNKYQRAKVKIQEEYEILKSKSGGKSYLIRSRHVLWDIIVDINKIWNYIVIMDEENSLEKRVEKDIEVVFQKLGNKP